MTAVESECPSNRDDSTTHSSINSAGLHPSEIVAALRARVLTLTPADINLESFSTATCAWGVVIETAHPDAVASLVVLADGSVSLYVSDGNGCVGCGAHRDVRIAGAELLEVAQRSFTLAVRTDDIGYPPPGNIRFYFLCFDELRSVQVRIEDLNSTDAQLCALYFAGQRVINSIERVGAGQSLEHEIRLALSSSAPILKGSTACLSVGNAVRRLRT